MDYLKNYLSSKPTKDQRKVATKDPRKTAEGQTAAERAEIAEAKRRAAKAQESKAVIVARPKRALLRKIQKVRRMLSVLAGGAPVTRTAAVIYMLNTAVEHLDYKL